MQSYSIFAPEKVYKIDNKKMLEALEDCSHDMRNVFTVLQAYIPYDVVTHTQEENDYLAREMQYFPIVFDTHYELLLFQSFPFLDSAFVSCSFQSFWEDIQKNLLEKYPERQVSFKEGINTSFYTVPFIFYRVLYRILENALIYSPDFSDVHVSLEKREGKIFLFVKNNGSFVQKDNISRFGEKYFRGEYAKKNAIPGKGLGLYISQLYMKELQGQILFDIQEGILETQIILPLKKD